MPYRADAFDIRSEYEAVSAARDCCCLGAIGQRDYSLAGEEDYPSVVVQFG